jgi:hypothetical protein
LSNTALNVIVKDSPDGMCPLFEKLISKPLLVLELGWRVSENGAGKLGQSTLVEDGEHVKPLSVYFTVTVEERF